MAIGGTIRKQVNRLAQPAGISFVEVLLAVLILAVLGVSVLGLLNFALKVIAENKFRTGAVSIANEALETVRNVPYADVGTQGGIVSGILPQSETAILNDTTYTISSTVTYVDDPFDGTVALGTDTLGNDYKSVRVAVSWEGHFGTNQVLGVTTVAPQGIETNEGGGVLKINVIDASGAAVDQANIHVINSSVSPAIDDDTLLTNSNGEFVTSVPASNSSYQIVVTKTGYSSDYNCAIDPVGTGCSASEGNPDPTKPRATVLESQLTEVTFAIDQVSTLRINTLSQDNPPDEWVVNTDSSGEDQRNPSMILGTDGNYYFAWQDFRNSAARIYGQEYDGATNQWTPDLAITSANNQNAPDLAMDSYGDLYITWQDDRNGNQDIYFNKFDNSGVELWGSSTKVNTDSGSADQFAPKVAVSATTTTSLEWVSWMDTRAGGGDADIYLQKFDIDGNAMWGSEVKVNFASTSQFQATDTSSWTFNNSLSYSCDGGNCDGDTDAEVTGGYAQLVAISSCTGTATACTSMSVQSTCDAQSGCGWDSVGPCADGSCQCGNLSDQTSCESADSCTWAAGAEGCSGSCDCWEISGKNNCLSVPGCGWYWFFCYPTSGCSCGSIGSESLCSNAACSWGSSGGSCSGSCSCSNISSDPLCSTLSCEWDSAGPCEGTADACTTFSTESTCQGQNGCSWVAGSTFPATIPTVQPITSLEVSDVISWDSFTETATKNGGEIYYQLSDNDGGTWKYWNGSTWSTAGAGDYNTASVVNTNISEFAATKEKILFRAFLESDGTYQVQLDNIAIGYTYTSTGGNYSQSVDLVVDNNDNTYVAWETYDSSDFDVFMQKIDTDGTIVWANDLRVHTIDSGYEQNNPTLAIDSNEDLIIAWQDDRNGNNVIYLQKYDTDGTLIWSSGDIQGPVYGSSEQRNPSIAIDSSNNVFIAWQDDRNGDNDIYLQKLNSSGIQQWSEDVRVNSSSTGDQSNPDIVINGSGNPVVTWQDNQSGEYDIVAAEYGGDPSSTSAIGNVGLTITGAKQVGNNPVIYKYAQNLTTDASGNLVLNNMEWDTYSIVLQGGSGYTIVGSDPPLPYALSPNSDTTINILLE